VLNRYGLFEADDHLRNLERRWHTSGSQEDRSAYLGALRRIDPHSADKLHMAPHVKEWGTADEEHNAALSGSAFNTSHQKRLAAAKEHRKKAALDLHSAAAEIERHPGEFFEKRKGEAPRTHVHRLATLAAGNDYGAGSFMDDRRFNFWHPHDAAKHAEHLNKSIQHHYPHWKSRVADWAQGSKVFHKGSVRLTADDEWGQPHQPDERK